MGSLPIPAFPPVSCHRFPSRNDLYCVGWDVKFYSLPRAVHVPIKVVLIVRIRQKSTLPQRSSAFTGCASQNVSTSNWQLWRIDPSTAPLRPIYSHVSPAFPTWHPDDGCGLQPHIVWTFRPFASLQSADGRFRFLVPPSKTICLSTSHLRRHSRFSDYLSVFPFL